MMKISKEILYLLVKKEKNIEEIPLKAEEINDFIINKKIKILVKIKFILLRLQKLYLLFML